MSADDINSRLSRWSQRKLAARRGDVIDEPPVAKPPASAREQAPKADDGDDSREDAPALPPIDELTADSDYTVFLRENVPQALKSAALRKLWRSNPIFGHMDGLDDYCEDFNLVDTPITLAQTDYKVGKGFLDDVEEKLAKLDPANSNDAESKTAGETQSESEPDATESAGEATDVSENAAAGDDSSAAPHADETGSPPDSGDSPTKHKVRHTS